MFLEILPTMRLRDHHPYLSIRVAFVLLFAGLLCLFLIKPSSAGLTEDPFWESGLDDDSYCVAWGDYDNDGDLDLAVGNYGPNHIYENVNGTLGTEPALELSETEDTKVTHEVMWADIDDNGWLDLVAVNGAWGAGYDVVHLNFDGVISSSPDWTNENSDHSAGMDLGDYDNDGDLDLVTANYNGRECIYENQGGTFTTTPIWESYLFDDGTQDAVFLDVDDDDDLDLYFGCSATMDSTDSNADQMYFNDPGLWGNRRYGLLPDWRANNELWTTTVKAGDIDRDGDTDVVAANGYNNCNLVVMYENTGSTLDRDYSWEVTINWPYSCDLGDVDGDGWLDVAIASYNENVYLVRNNAGTLDTSTIWNSTDARKSYRCQWGDMNGDGLPELAVANYHTTSTLGNNTVYLNSVKKPVVAIERPSEGEIVRGIVVVLGSVAPGDSDVDVVELSFDGGGSWSEAEGTELWTYEWNTTELEDGNYTILAQARVGVLSSNMTLVNVTVNNVPDNHPPTIRIIKPDDGGEADEKFSIEWQASDDDGDTLEIYLYYDTDQDFGNGATLIAPRLENTGSHEWDCSGVEEGDYYICAVADDTNGSRALCYSSGMLRVYHESVNHDPEIDILAVGYVDDFTLEFLWSATDEDGESLEIDFYYDTDTNKDNGAVLMESGLENTGRYLWDVSEMEDGDYHVLGIARDERGGEEMNYSEQFTISLPELRPDFLVQSLELQPQEPKDGEDVTITVMVKNEGEARGEASVEFLVDGVLVTSEAVRLEPGEEKIITASWKATRGSHSFGVRVPAPGDPDLADNEAEESVDVGESSNKDEDDGLLYIVLGSSLAGVAVVGGVFLYWRQRAGGEGACPACGSVTTYYKEYDDYYCEDCEDYVGEG